MKKKKDWSPIGTLIKFQIRLIFDAIRDFILSPVSFICIIIDILIGKHTKKDSLFYKLMLLGRRTDQWINLFEQFNDNDKTAKDSVKKED
jgi:hypothetical protein